MRRAALLPAAAAVAALLVGWRMLATDLPDPSALMTRRAPDATKIHDRQGRLLYEVLDPRAGRRTRVPLAALPRHLRDAVVAVEDGSFYTNAGVDPRGIARAAYQAARQRRLAGGASTITQQLARAVLMTPEERVELSLRRKLREAILAVRISRAFSKDQVLELYLNEVYFGQLAYGAEAAAQTFFGKPAAQLDLAESALLAGLIQSPAAYNPLVDISAARARQAVVLRLMVERGLVAPEEAEMALDEPLHLAGGNVPLEAPHFVSYVLGQLEGQLGAEAVHGGGLHVVTTLDLDLQRRAEAVARHRLAQLAAPRPGLPDPNATNAALVAVDPATGDVLAMVGSADYFDSGIDGAVNVALAPRQPGSAFKPITYAAAFDVAHWGYGRQGETDASGRPSLPFTPATVLSDVPTSFTTREGDPYRPQNYDRMWHGPIDLRRALATSSNLVAVKVLEAVGLDAALDTAAAMGLTTLANRDRFGLALTLGGGEVRLLELTGAYATLATGGRRVTPRAILAIGDADEVAASGGDPVALVPDGAPATGERVLPPEVAYLVTDILSDDQARLPAFGEGSVLVIDRPAAAKTGTTTDFRDNWTVGYTPDMAVGVWVGNADNSPMERVSGLTGAGPIWHDVMLEAHQGIPPRPFPRPDGVSTVEVCTASGLLPTEACQRRRREVFVRGTEPRAHDTAYRSVDIDAATGRLWAPGCAGPRVMRVFRLLPADAADWGRQTGIPAPPATDCLGAVAAAPNLDAAGAQHHGLALTSPAPNAVFALTPQLPEAFQRVEIAARPAGGVAPREVRLLVDGQPLATTGAPPYRAHWPLEPGRHVARAVGIDAHGQPVTSAELSFHVLRRPPRGHEPLSTDR